jgi:uncharacterized phage protein gp47/JayE
MAITTNVPAIQFTPGGVVLPTEAEILAGVQADQNAAAGGSLSSTLTSPQGQEAQSATAIIGAKNGEIAFLVNQFDPDNASGKWQDGLGQLYFMTRIAASGSVVPVLLTGLVGATVLAGALVQDPSGYLWSLLADATFTVSGNVTADFQCQTTGPIALANGVSLIIYKAQVGWETATTSGTAVPGNDVESRADFEWRRQNSVASNSQNCVDATLGSVLAVPGVLDCYVIDNPQPTTVNTGVTNYPVVRNSIYVAAVGGAAADVAQAIWVKKPPGCNYNGNTSFTVTDTANTGKPTYVVSWETPTSEPVFITVNIANNPNLPSNIIALAQAAVLAAFNGQDGGSRSRIASTTYSGRFYAGLYAINPNVNVESVFLGLSASPTATALAMGIDQSPTLAQSNIVVNLI